LGGFHPTAAAASLPTLDGLRPQPPGRLRLAPEMVPRDREVREIAAALGSPEVRMLTLVGPPGAGKTRLAQMASTVVDRRFDHGACFVDLVPVSDARLVFAAVAAALGIRDMGGRALDESLVAVLRDQELLLVLDNFEHVLGAAEEVSRLLATCPRVKALVTSRSALGLAAEHRYEVPPLATPEPGAALDLAALARVPSVALFCMRARAAKHGWQLDRSNALAVAEVCRRLDGLPLAIELAASWMDMLSPAAVLPRLRACLDEEAGAATLDRPARHRTLTAAIAWSYELLSEEERDVFERLSMFAGGFTLEAAATVAKRSSTQTLGLLRGLVDKHLVVSREVSDGEPRFEMLVTLHAFAVGRLATAVHGDAVRRQHAQVFLELAETAEPALIGPGQREWLDRLEREYDNMRAALGWALEVGELQLALRLGAALWFFWDMRGHLREGRDWLKRVLEHPVAQAVTPARVSALNAAGWLALVAGEYGAAAEVHEAALGLARQLNQPGAISRSAMHLGLALGLGPQDFDRALALYAEALPIAHAGGDVWTVGLGLYGQGHVAALRGDLDEVNRLWRECFAVCESVKSLYALSYLQFRWGVLALQAGAFDRAQACLLEALRFGDEVDSSREMGVAMDALAWVAVAQKQVERAAGLFGAAQALFDRAGYNLPPFMAAAHERAMAGAQAALGASAFRAAWAAGRQLSGVEEYLSRDWR